MLVSSYDLAIKKLSELEKTTIVPNFEFTVSKFDYQEMYLISFDECFFVMPMPNSIFTFNSLSIVRMRSFVKN
jgi:hypothetical protein